MSQNLPEFQRPPAMDLSHVDVDTVNAEKVQMHQSSARAINAENVDLSQSGALNLQGDRVAANLSGLVIVQANDVDMQNSGAAAIRAGNVFLNGYAGAVAAGSVEFGHSYAGLLAGREVRGEKIESVVLLAGKVEGDVTTVIDTRGALIAGLVGGLFAGIILLLGRALFGRK